MGPIFMPDFPDLQNHKPTDQQNENYNFLYFPDFFYSNLRPKTNASKVG